jgi:tetratricopeptide (TPR) repeat protein
LGHVSSKEKNYPQAIKYFEKSLLINKKSAILNFYMATALEQNQDITKSLEYLKKAEELDNNNPMIKYQRAHILVFKNRDYDKAMEIVLELNEKMPKEAAIQVLIGQIYKFKKEFTKALNHFNQAIDIDPKDSNQAKSHIESLYLDMDNHDIMY